MPQSFEDYKKKLAEQIELFGNGCCIGCGMTTEAANNIIDKSSLKEEIEGKKLSRQNCPLHIDVLEDYNYAINDILKLID